MHFYNLLVGVCDDRQLLWQWAIGVSCTWVLVHINLILSSSVLWNCQGQQFLTWHGLVFHLYHAWLGGHTLMGVPWEWYRANGAGGRISFWFARTHHDLATPLFLCCINLTIFVCPGCLDGEQFWETVDMSWGDVWRRQSLSGENYYWWEVEGMWRLQSVQGWGYHRQRD